MNFFRRGIVIFPFFPLFFAKRSQDAEVSVEGRGRCLLDEFFFVLWEIILSENPVLCLGDAVLPCYCPPPHTGVRYRAEG